MTTGNSIADQGDKEYNRRGLCPDCKRELILADEFWVSIYDKKDGKTRKKIKYRCYCGYEFEEEK